MEQMITCINCPVGCRMQVTLQNGEITALTGNACKRGINYAQQECIAPKRMVTAVVSLQGRAMPLSIKTREPIPKSKIFEVMRVLSQLQLTPPIQIGEAVYQNICDTGVDVIATKTVE